MKKYLLLLIILSPYLAESQSDKEKVIATVEQSTIEGHIYFLASDELKGREAGTPEIDIAAKYLGTTFRRYGVAPVLGASEGYYQNIAFKKSTPANITMLKINNNTYEKALSLSKTNAKINGPVLALNYGLEEDYKKAVDYRNKIIVVKAGSKADNSPNSLYRLSQQKKELAIKNGVKAVIELHNFESNYWSNVNNYFGHESFELYDDSSDTSKEELVHLWLNVNEVPDLNSLKELELNIEGAETNIVTSSNVVGMVEGTDPKLKDEFIIYSAHYDHVGLGKPNAEGDSIYNGARDNAVGTVTVLSAAENIAKYPTKRSALFILFTAEEKGLLGSKYYVDNPLIPLEQIVFCFNSDNASYNDTTKATIVGLNRTTAANHIKSAATAFNLSAIDDPAPEQNLFDRSDNVHFAKAGIPAPTFSLGFTAFDAEVFKYYHQPSDNPDNLNYEYLTKFFKSYVLSCRNIANAQETPFWVEGDKYFESGQALYKK